MNRGGVEILGKGIGIEVMYDVGGRECCGNVGGEDVGISSGDVKVIFVMW